MRTVHSCINRAPAHLLKEVILVNDHSTKTELYDELKAYLASNFEGKAHVIDLPKRSGLVSFDCFLLIKCDNFFKCLIRLQLDWPEHGLQ